MKNCRLKFYVRMLVLMGLVLGNLASLTQAMDFSRRLLCGGTSNYTDSNGYLWNSDQDYNASQGSCRWGYISGSHASQFNNYDMENTWDWPLYRQERGGAYGDEPAYRFDVPGPGDYYIKLLFSEMYFGVQIRNGTGIGQRVFNVFINGQKVLDHFDIMAETGGRAERAVIKTFKVNVPADGDYANRIVIQTGNIISGAKINAIEIASRPTVTDTIDRFTKSEPGGAESYKLNCGGTKIVDPSLSLWMGDEAFSQRRRWGYERGTEKIDPSLDIGRPDIYRMATWREGGTDFKYLFSLPNGTYQLKLYFQENEATGPGQRVFDVAVNQHLVASHLDVYQLKGSHSPYQIIVPVQVTGQQLEISFPSITAGLAMLNAVEIDVSAVSDNDFLDFVERKAMNYFIAGDPGISGTNPVNGLVADRSRNIFDGSWSNASIAAVGFGLAAVTAGEERGWIPAADAEAQLSTTLTTFNNAAPYVSGNESGLTNKNGFYFHFLDIASGQRAPEAELSSIDSALLFAGIMAVQGSTHSGGINNQCSSILNKADWPWFVNNNPNGFVSRKWDSQTGFPADRFWDGYNEGALIYFMAMAAQHPIAPMGWFNQEKHWRTDVGHCYMTDNENAATLFRQIYPQCFVDLRQTSDAKNDYFYNTQQAVMANQQYCQNHSEYLTYSQGGWGPTSSDSPRQPINAVLGAAVSYQEYKPQSGMNDGTVNPSIVGAAIPFYPSASIRTLRAMYYQYKYFLWGRFGFSDAYNLNAPMTLNPDAGSGRGWVAPDVIGIDLGSMILGIENYRTGNIWRAVEQSGQLQTSLQRLGMGDDLIDNFDNDHSQDNAVNERDGQWWSPSPQSYQLSMAEGIGGNQTPALKITYTKAAGSEWDYVVLGNLSNNANQSYYLRHTQLHLEVYGTVKLLLKFQDRNGQESQDSGVINVDNNNHAWRTVVWDYGRINWGQCNPREINEILVFIQPGLTGSGEIAVDNIGLGPWSSSATPTMTPLPETMTPTPTFSATSTPTPTPVLTPSFTTTQTVTATSTTTSTFTLTPTPTPTGMDDDLIDNFDNDHSQDDAANERDGQWWSPSPQSYQLSMAEGIGGNQTTALKITYTKAAGSEWDYVVLGDLINHGNQSDYLGHTQLHLDVYGTVKLLLKFQDRNGKESQDSGVINVDNNDHAWRTVVWDYGRINWGQCNPGEINGILVFVQPDLTGSGELYVDNIGLGSTSFSATPTATPSITANDTATPTSTATATTSFTSTSTATPGNTSTASPSDTATTTATLTFTLTPTTTPTATPTYTYSPTFTPSATASDSPTSTHTPTMTPTPTSSSTFTPIATPTAMPSFTVTDTATPTSTATATFTTTPTATPTGMDDDLIDNFDNDHSQDDAANERDGQWWSPSPQSYQMGIAEGIGGNQTPALKITYTKAAGSEWDYVVLGDLGKIGNQSIYLGHTALHLDIYGTVKVLLKFQDRNGKEAQDSGIITVDNNDHSWRTVIWDYSRLDWGQCNPGEINEILVFVQPGLTGSGELYVDNIGLGLSSSPTVTPPNDVHTASGHSSPNPSVNATNTVNATRTLTITFTPTPTASPTLTITVTATSPKTESAFQQLISDKKVVAYPNPAHGKVNFAYEMPESGSIRVECYQLNGDRVASVREEKCSSGRHVEQTIWDTHQLAPGIYIVRFQARGQDGKMIINKVMKIAVLK